MAISHAARPFLRWPGGKRLLALQIMAQFPSEYSRYVEPFVGSGAVFFMAAPRNALLADRNEELINAFSAVRDKVEDVIAWLESHRQNKKTFLQIRKLRPKENVDRAGRLIYLNRTAFNGIWRVNRAGEFNVPYGKRKRKDLIGADNLRRAAAALTGIDLKTGSFLQTLSRVQSGDLVYADTPYTVLHTNNGFRKYNEVLFSWEDQILLADMLTELARNGASVVVSNSDNADVRKLYAHFREVILTRFSPVAASANARGQITESLFVLPGE